MRIVLNVKYQIFLSDFNENTILSQSFRKIIKFHENPSGTSLVLGGQTERQTEERTDKTKLIVAFRNFTKASNKTFQGDKCLIILYSFRN